MDNKKVGIVLLIVGMVIASTVFVIKAKEDSIINKFMMQEGTCFLEDGTCLHEDRFITGYIIGWKLSAAVITLGIYLLVFDKSHKQIADILERQKQLKIQEEKFDILLKGLDEEEKKVIKAVKEQDGVTQQTLRLRTDLHKSKLSIVLDRLEKKDLVKRVSEGKTKKVFLKIDL